MGKAASPRYVGSAIWLRHGVIYGAPVFIPVSLTRSALTCTLLKLQQTSRSYSEGWFGFAVGVNREPDSSRLWSGSRAAGGHTSTQPAEFF